MDNLKTILKQSFDYAFRNHLIEDNPYNRLDYSIFKDMLVTKTSIRSREHSKNDIKRMMDYVHNKQQATPRYVPAYALELQFLMGLRRGEVPPLLWSDILKRLKDVHDRYYPDSDFLFPAKTEEGCITNNTVYGFYRRMCKKLNIPISRDLIKGTHAFRRTQITAAVNNSGGNLVMAAELFGNSPEVIRKNYFTGVPMDAAREIVEDASSF